MLASRAPARAALPPLVLACLAALYLIWSSTYLAIRYAVEALPPLLSAGARYCVAGSILYVFLRARGVPAPTRRQWLFALPIGALMFLIGNGLVMIAEQRVSSGLAAVACASTPVFVCGAAHFFGDRTSRREWVGVAVGFAGIVLLTAGELRAARADGVLLLFAPMGWALGTVLSRHLPLPRGPMAAAMELFAGGLLEVIVAVGIGEHVPSAIPVRGAIAIAYLVVFGSIIGFSAYNHLIQTTRPSLATSYAYVNPVLAVVLGAVVGGERPGAGLILPGALVVAGVAVMATGRAENAAQPRTEKAVEPRA